MTESEGSGVRDPPPSYMIFLVVFLFFLTGLLGFLVCHLLKKKGYRCRTGDMEDEEEEEKLGENADDENDENQDTVEQILKCIIENEANMEAFNEMLGNHNVCVRHDPRLRKESIGGVPPHLHTVHSGTDHNSCLLCAQVQSKKGRRQSRTPRFKQRPGEQTVFSVGRFRVTHTDKKLHGGPLAISGDQLDQSQDSDERKDGRQNLKSMFKDVRLPSEGSNANMGKQKKSVTIFGLRRGSDPLGLKVKEGTGRQTGGVKFAFQQPPVVLEEPLQAENTEGDSKQSTEPGSKPKTEPTLSQHEVKISDSVNSPSIQTKKPAPDLSTDPQDGPKLGLSPKPDETMMTRPSVQSMVATAPTSLPILSEKRVNVDDVVLKTEEANITGPLQTSTPIALMPASMSSFTSGIPPGQPKLHSNKDVLVAQTSSDPCFSPDQEVCSGAGLALISLGSSPQSSFPIKTLSSVSSLKTPTSSLNESPSPKSSSRNMESEAAKAVPVSPQPLPSSPADKNLSLTRSPHPTFKLENETKGHLSSSSASMKDQKLEEQTILKTDEKTDTIRAGISKTDKLSPVDSKGFGLFLPSDQIFKDRLSSSPLSPSSSLDPSSPKGSRISSVAIVKASPDSKREFSVVTIVDEEVSCTSVKDQEKETREHDFKPENKEISSAVKEQRDCPVSSIRESENQSRETSEVEIWSTPGQGTDDLAGIEDIIHCKVPQVEGAPRLEEESEKVTHTHLKQDEERKSQKNEEFDPEKKRSDTTD